MINIIADESYAVDAGLKMAEEGDFLLILGDDITRCWKQIVHFNSENTVPATTPTKEHTSNSAIEDYQFEIEEGQKIIQDERGVRLAKEESD